MTHIPISQPMDLMMSQMMSSNNDDDECASRVGEEGVLYERLMLV